MEFFIFSLLHVTCISGNITWSLILLQRKTTAEIQPQITESVHKDTQTRKLYSQTQGPRNSQSWMSLSLMTGGYSHFLLHVGNSTPTLLPHPHFGTRKLDCWCLRVWTNFRLWWVNRHSRRSKQCPSRYLGAACDPGEANYVSSLLSLRSLSPRHSVSVVEPACPSDK